MSFRDEFELKPEFRGNPECEAAYEYACENKLYIEEINYIGAVTQRKKPTIQELEAILDGPEREIIVKSNGEIATGRTKDELIADLKSQLAERDREIERLKYLPASWQVQQLEAENATLKQTIEMLKLGRPLDDIDRQRARALEAENAALKANADLLRDTREAQGLRIATLEAENANLKTQNAHLMTTVFEGAHDGAKMAASAMMQLTESNTTLQNKLAAAEAALKEIEEHPHCREDQVHWPHPTLDPYDDSQWRMGYSHGHRCAAAIARRWREAK